MKQNTLYFTAVLPGVTNSHLPKKGVLNVFLDLAFGVFYVVNHTPFRTLLEHLKTHYRTKIDFSQVVL